MSQVYSLDESLEDLVLLVKAALGPLQELTVRIVVEAEGGRTGHGTIKSKSRKRECQIHGTALSLPLCRKKNAERKQKCDTGRNGDSSRSGRTRR